MTVKVYVVEEYVKKDWQMTRSPKKSPPFGYAKRANSRTDSAEKEIRGIRAEILESVGLLMSKGAGSVMQGISISCNMKWDQ